MKLPAGQFGRWVGGRFGPDPAVAVRYADPCKMIIQFAVGEAARLQRLLCQLRRGVYAAASSCPAAGRSSLATVFGIFTRTRCACTCERDVVVVFCGLVVHELYVVCVCVCVVWVVWVCAVCRRVQPTDCGG